MSLVGYSVTIYRLLPADIAALRVPDGIRPSRTAGIICAELLDGDYCRAVNELGYPVIFVDFPVYTDKEEPYADIVLMDNEKCISSFIRQMLSNVSVFPRLNSKKCIVKMAMHNSFTFWRTFG